MRQNIVVFTFFAFLLLGFTSSAPCQWVQTTGITADNIGALAVHGSDLFAGSTWPSSGGVYRSTDGMNWTAVNSGLTNLEIHALLVSGTNLLAGTADGAFHSSNNGASWVASEGLAGKTVNALIESGSNLYAGTYNYQANKGVFLSSDGGASWTAINGTTDWKNLAVNALVMSGANLLAGVDIGSDGNGGIMRSSDNGTTWSAVTGLPKKPAKAFATIGNNLFAGIYGGGVYLSTDNGASWAAVNTDLTRGVEGFAVSGTDLFAGGNSGSLFLSTDNGTNWTSVNTGFPSSDQFQRLAVSGTNLFAGTASGVWKRSLSEFGTAGVSEANPDSIAMEISPNPTNGTITLHGLTVGSRFEVMSLLGEHLTVDRIAGTSDPVFDLSQLPSSTYFVRISTGRLVTTKVVVKK